MKRSDQDIPVVYYHSVGLKNPVWKNNFLTLELIYFEDQLRYFKRYFNVISLSDYYEIRKGERKPVNNALVITFDDGYLDNWIWAFPLLKKYNLRATIFISPEFADNRSTVRPNLEDVWKGTAGYDDLNQWGFLSYEEMKVMQESGLIDFGSHTMTHGKHFVSDRITDFHNPGYDSLFLTGNLFPDRKPYYIGDSDFAKLVPYGYPVFDMQPAITNKLISINPQFINQCISILEDFDYDHYDFTSAFRLVMPVYDKFRHEGELVISSENDDQYTERLRYEICGSKRVLEEKLTKEIEFLCWPFGESNETAHKIAIEAGYKATTTGSRLPVAFTPDRISGRIGLFHSKNNRFLSAVKMRYKIRGYQNKFPYAMLNKSYSLLRYGKLPVRG
jgi:hypothetical protein